ncbi:hypothetical protein HMPREF9996_02250 [Aggregatibacter actinomycetemcomitans Y4]|nr:hypothetical protein HMPREF9996_02250 [Aggregatibacter actinomycetemcomitans Y4]
MLITKYRLDTGVIKEKCGEFWGCFFMLKTLEILIAFFCFCDGSSVFAWAKEKY